MSWNNHAKNVTFVKYVSGKAAVTYDKARNLYSIINQCIVLNMSNRVKVFKTILVPMLLFMAWKYYLKWCCYFSCSNCDKQTFSQSYGNSTLWYIRNVKVNLKLQIAIKQSVSIQWWETIGTASQWSIRGMGKTICQKQ